MRVTLPHEARRFPYACLVDEPTSIRGVTRSDANPLVHTVGVTSILTLKCLEQYKEKTDRVSMWLCNQIALDPSAFGQVRDTT